MKVKMIIERIRKALLKSQINYSFELIYSHGVVSGTSLSLFLVGVPEYLFLVRLAKYLVLKKCFDFVGIYVLKYYYGHTS